MTETETLRGRIAKLQRGMTIASIAAASIVLALAVLGTAVLLTHQPGTFIGVRAAMGMAALLFAGQALLMAAVLAGPPLLLTVIRPMVDMVVQIQDDLDAVAESAGDELGRERTRRHG